MFLSMIPSWFHRRQEFIGLRWYQPEMQQNRQGQSGVEMELVSFNYGKMSAIYIHLQQTLICCTACLQAPSILGCSIDISACSTIVSYISHPAEPLETILIGQ